jgi:thymidylate synthase ThyX
MRHRIASYNEESGRYRQLDSEFYFPNTSRNLQQVGKTGAYTFEPGTPEQYKLTEDSPPNEACIEVIYDIKNLTPELYRLYNKINNF